MLLDEKSKLTFRIGFQSLSRRAVVQRQVGSRSQQFADQSRLASLPRTDNVDNPAGGQGAVDAPEQMSSYQGQGRSPFSVPLVRGE